MTDASTVVAAALSQVGKPYIFDTPLDAHDPNPASFDCSGLTMWSYAKAGITLPHQSGQQYAQMQHRPRSQAQPGDIIFYQDSIGRIYHCAIYIGNGQMCEAPHTHAYVLVRTIWGTPMDTVGMFIAPPPAKPNTYVVKSGDTLTRIATKYSTTVTQLVAWNVKTYPTLATNPGLIQVGWTLVVGQ